MVDLLEALKLLDNELKIYRNKGFKPWCKVHLAVSGHRPQWEAYLFHLADFEATLDQQSRYKRL